jgi:hypothetical protein
MMIHGILPHLWVEGAHASIFLETKNYQNLTA